MKNFLAIIATIALVAGLIYGIHYVGEHPDLSSVVNAITIKSSPNPDCGSTIAKESVIKIVSDHGKNQLTALAASQSKTVAADMKNPPIAKLLAEKEATVAAFEPQKNESALQTKLLIGKVSHKYQCDAQQYPGAGRIIECPCARDLLKQIQQIQQMLQTGQMPDGTVVQQNMHTPMQQRMNEKLQGLQDDAPAAKQIVQLCDSGESKSGLLQQRVLDKEIAELRPKLENEALSIVEKAQQSATYTLDTIRMTARDAETRTASCVAKLTAQVSDGQAQAEINYKVENTTDGDLYVTVFNLQ